MYLESTTCCGVDDLDGVSNREPKEILLSVGAEKYGDLDWGGEPDCKQAFILITDVIDGSSKLGARGLVAYIAKYGLGYTVATRQKKNPNSGNIIKAWLWSPDERALRAWYKKHS